MVRIRFRRVGARNQPSFRIVAADQDSPRDGRFLEVLGSYNPRTTPSTLKVDEARLFHWMSHGAQPSDSVVQTLQSVGTWERWERFKGGESIEKLIQEAEAAMPEADPRTRRDDLIGQRSKKRRKHAETKPKAEAEAAAEEPAAEAEEPSEAESAEASAAEEEGAETEAGAEAEADEGAEAEADEGAEAESESESESESEGDTGSEDEAEGSEDEAAAEDSDEAEEGGE